MRTKTQLLFFSILFPVMVYSHHVTPGKTALKHSDKRPIFYLDLGYSNAFFTGGNLSGGNFGGGFIGNNNKKFDWGLTAGLEYFYNFKHTPTDTLPNFSGIKSFGNPFFSFHPTIKCNDNFNISFPIKTSFNGSIFTNGHGLHSEYGPDASWINNKHISVFSCGINAIVRIKGIVFGGAELDYRFVYNYSGIQPSIGKKGDYNGLTLNLFLRLSFEN